MAKRCGCTRRNIRVAALPAGVNGFTAEELLKLITERIEGLHFLHWRTVSSQLIDDLMALELRRLLMPGRRLIGLVSLAILSVGLATFDSCRWRHVHGLTVRNGQHVARLSRLMARCHDYLRSKSSGSCR